MSGASIPNPRFVAQNATAEDQLKSQTVGLVALSDFRKRRAEVLEQSQRDRTLGSAGAGTSSGAATPSGASTPRDGTASPRPLKKKLRKAAAAKIKLSFGREDDDDEDDNKDTDEAAARTPRSKSNTPDVRSAAMTPVQDTETDEEAQAKSPPLRKRLAANPTLGVPAPKAMTKSALLRDAQTREQLRREYLAMQEAVKATEIVVPFVFYDGTNIPGGKCRVKKGDHIWLFLDKARKLGAELGVGGNVDGTKKGGWARVSVDDLMLVKGEIIIPHHYDFYYFLLNKTLSFSGQPIFPYSSQPTSTTHTPAPEDLSDEIPSTYDPMARPSKNAAPTVPDSELEGYNDDPLLTRVVDRRWYERNKHIFPASVWEEFDPTKEYHKAVRTDNEGNKFFF